MGDGEREASMARREKRREGRGIERGGSTNSFVAALLVEEAPSASRRREALKSRAAEAHIGWKRARLDAASKTSDRRREETGSRREGLWSEGSVTRRRDADAP